MITDQLQRKTPTSSVLLGSVDWLGTCWYFGCKMTTYRHHVIYHMTLEVISMMEMVVGGERHNKIDLCFTHLFILVFARVKAPSAVAVSTAGHLHSIDTLYKDWWYEFNFKKTYFLCKYRAQG